jgi:hypothetical protein
VDGAQVGIFEKTNQVGLCGFLEGQDGRSLESKVGLEILGDLTDKSLEGQLADEKVRRFLITTDLSKGDGTRSVSVRLLDTSGGRSGLASGLGGKLLSGSLSSGGFTSGLLRKEKGEAVRYHVMNKEEDVLMTAIEVFTLVLAIFDNCGLCFYRDSMFSFNCCVLVSLAACDKNSGPGLARNGRARNSTLHFLRVSYTGATKGVPGTSGLHSYLCA